MNVDILYSIFNIYCIKNWHSYSNTVTKKNDENNTNTTIISVVLNTKFLVLLAKNINFDKV